MCQSETGRSGLIRETKGESLRESQGKGLPTSTKRIDSTKKCTERERAGRKKNDVWGRAVASRIQTHERGNGFKRGRKGEGHQT